MVNCRDFKMVPYIVEALTMGLKGSASIKNLTKHVKQLLNRDQRHYVPKELPDQLRRAIDVGQNSGLLKIDFIELFRLQENVK